MFLRVKQYLIQRRVQWFILIAFCALFFVSHTYNDILITTRSSINMWDALFQGKILSFYSFNQLIVSGNVFYNIAQSAVYAFPIYIIFALWNFPLWVFERVFNFDVMNGIVFILYSKAMLVFFLWISARTLKKICISMKMLKDTADWCVFYFLSSALIFSSLFVMSQYDIISLTFILLGFHQYLKHNLKGFILWFILAISLKFFALFAFIPLVLLYEKKIWKIIAYGLSGISLTVVFSMIFSGDLAFKASGKFTLDMLKLFTNQAIPLSIGASSLFLVLIALLFIYGYYREVKSDEELNRLSVYLVFVSYAIFFAFTKSYPYWLVLITPFMALLIFLNLDKFRINRILEIAFSVSAIASQMIVYYWCFGIKTIQPMLLPKLFGEVASLPHVISTEAMVSHTSLYTLLTSLLLPMLIAVFVASLIALAVINFPRSPLSNEKELVEPSIFLHRLFIYALLCSLPILGYLVSVIIKAVSI